MAPQPSLDPAPAFEHGSGLTPYEPSRFSSNPTFDQGFIQAAYAGDLRLVKREYAPLLARPPITHFPVLVYFNSVLILVLVPMRSPFQGPRGCWAGGRKAVASPTSWERSGTASAMACCTPPSSAAACPCAATWSRTSGWMSMT